MKGSLELLHALSLLTLLAVGVGGRAVAEDVVSIDAVLAKLAPPPSDQALVKIPDSGRKILALRSYVRYGAKIADRWSWTEDQMRAFQGSSEQQLLLADIAAVNEHFKTANPGYEIYVHGTVRSLDDQLAIADAGSLSGGAIRNLFPGQFEAVVKGYRVFLSGTRGGSLRGFAFGQQDSGRWFVKGSTLCVMFKNWTEGQAHCGTLSQQNGWYVANGASGVTLRFRRSDVALQ